MKCLLNIRKITPSQNYTDHTFVLVKLNLAEGSGRRGADRRRFYRTAHGSLLEARTALAIATRLGYLDRARATDAERIADRLGGLLWRLAR
jgi:four helix bundle protein